jgi:hypothetical protein
LPDDWKGQNDQRGKYGQLDGDFWHNYVIDYEKNRDNGTGNNNNNLLPTFTLLPGISNNDTVSGFLIPPDNATVVDTSWIIQAVNDVVKWTDLGGNNTTEQAMTTFFAPLPNYDFFLDPRSLYDTATGQFVLCAGTEGTASGMTTNGNAYVLLAVSKDGNPNDGWNEYSYQFTPTPNVIDVTNVDQPSIAADGTTFFVVASVSNDQLELVIPRDGVGAAMQIDFGSNDIAGIYKQIAVQGQGDYALAQNNGVLTLQHISTAGVIDGTSSVSLGTVGTSTSTLSSTNGEQYLPTAGTSQPLDAEDTRIYSVTAPDSGIMYATFEVTPTSGADAGTPNTHWVELNVSDPSHMTLVDQGTVSGSMISAGVGTSTGSVGVDAAGDAILNFVASGPNLTPTDYFEIKRDGEPTFSAPTAWDFSAGTYFQSGASMFGTEVASRWGDYSSAVADPNNPQAFYISNEIGITPGNFGWATPIAHVTIPTTTTV